MLVDEIEEVFGNICFNFHVAWGLNQVMFSFLGFLRFGEVVECMEYGVQGECPKFSKPRRKVE